MLRTRVAAGVAATALIGTMGFAAATPAMAKGKSTTVTFTSSVTTAMKGAGITVTAVKPGKAKGKSFVFPAKVKGTTVTHKGGLTLENSAAGKSLTIEKIKLDLSAKTASVTVGGNEIPAFTLAKVKTNKKTKVTTAKLKVAPNIAGALNGLLATTIFKDGQVLANTSTG
jgi:hypothetical protein